MVQFPFGILKNQGGVKGENCMDAGSLSNICDVRRFNAEDIELIY
jgi:hypothetical protein